jgi:hypothetical protein
MSRSQDWFGFAEIANRPDEKDIFNVLPAPKINKVQWHRVTRKTSRLSFTVPSRSEVILSVSEYVRAVSLRWRSGNSSPGMQPGGASEGLLS